MYGNTLLTLYKFLGKDLVKKENEKNLDEAIFDKLKGKNDFKELFDNILKIEDYDISNYLKEKYLRAIFNKLKLKYKEGTIYYGDKKENVDFNDSAIIQITNLIDNTKIESEKLFIFLTGNIDKIINAYRELLGEENNSNWTEEEIKNYVKNMKPLTINFLNFLVKKGEADTSEIMKELELENTRGVSALVSAVIRNASKDKEKIIYKEEGKIKINPKYRDNFIKYL
jgi:hypothetical protein